MAGTVFESWMSMTMLPGYERLGLGVSVVITVLFIIAGRVERDVKSNTSSTFLMIFTTNEDVTTSDDILRAYCARLEPLLKLP